MFSSFQITAIWRYIPERLTCFNTVLRVSPGGSIVCNCSIALRTSCAFCCFLVIGSVIVVIFPPSEVSVTLSHSSTPVFHPFYRDTVDRVSTYSLAYVV